MEYQPVEYRTWRLGELHFRIQILEIQSGSALVLHSDLHVMRHRGWLRHANSIATQTLQMELDGLLDQLLCLRKSFPDCHTPGQVRDIGAVASLALLDYYCVSHMFISSQPA